MFDFAHFTSMLPDIWNMTRTTKSATSILEVALNLLYVVWEE
ncbi:hypothetical protein [Kurthia senegalensis]|nr:hypothetical protein [Kurthia senegalensis]